MPNPFTYSQRNRNVKGTLGPLSAGRQFSVSDQSFGMSVSVCRVPICSEFLCLVPILDISFISFLVHLFVTLWLHPSDSYLVSMYYILVTLLRAQGTAGNKQNPCLAGTTSPRRNHLQTPRFQTSGVQGREKISSHHLSHPICGSLSQKAWEANTASKLFILLQKLEPDVSAAITRTKSQVHQLSGLVVGHIHSGWKAGDPCYAKEAHLVIPLPAVAWEADHVSTEPILLGVIGKS